MGRRLDQPAAKVKGVLKRELWLEEGFPFKAGSGKRGGTLYFHVVCRIR